MPKRIFVSKTQPTRTAATVRSYLKGGFVLLARAWDKMVGQQGDVIEAFRALFTDPDLVYRPATTRLYKQQIKAVIAYKLHAGELNRDRARSGFAELTTLLNSLRGPCPKRTSRAKLKTPNQAEYRQILRDFDRRSRLPGGLDQPDIVLSLLVGLGPYFGLRPSEWLGATICGNTLNVVNAKSTNGRAAGESRSIALERFPLGIAKLAGHLVVQMRSLFDRLGGNWRQLLGRLGERLARVCARLKLRRWSLYTTRHIAMANWKRAGFSPAEIAALAGHISTRTARDHYAGGRHGWAMKFACARPDPDITSSIALHNSPTPIRSAHGEATIEVMVDAPATAIERPLVAELDQKITERPRTEDDTTLMPVIDAIDEPPTFSMR